MEPLPRRDGRLRRDFAAAVVPVVPRGGSRQDERDCGAASAGARATHRAPGLAREYLAMAEELLRPAGPCLLAVGGLSGSGKSTLALGLAPVGGRGARCSGPAERRDRKRLCGVAPLQHLGPEGYAPGMSERVYATLAERAALILREGHSVIVDAVYARENDREAIERVAREASAPFAGLWLETPESLLIARTEQRKNDASDADALVVRMQGGQKKGVIRWCQLDASGPATSVLASATNSIRNRLPERLNGDHEAIACLPV